MAGALALFWRHGYEGASLDGLRRAMGGLSSASFYAAFGSEEALCRETLDLYLRTHGRAVTSSHDAALSPRERVERALRASPRMQTGDGRPPGCFVTLSAMVCSPDGDALRAPAAAERCANRGALRAAVEAAVGSGQLRADTDAAGLATLFEGLLLGLSIQALDGAAPAGLDAAVTGALTAWDAHLPHRPAGKALSTRAGAVAASRGEAQ